MNIAAAVVINLARREDRRAAFENRWAATGLGDRVRLRILPATDDRAQRCLDPHWMPFPSGARGCWDSHIRALDQAGSAPLLVLEDDCVFSDDFAAVLTALTPPPDWEILHLGGQHVISPVLVAPGIVRPCRLYRSHAYLARFPRAVAAQLRTHRTHVDVALGRAQLVRYAVTPWIAGQDGSLSDITRTPGATEFWQEEVPRGA